MFGFRGGFSGSVGGVVIVVDLGVGFVCFLMHWMDGIGDF